MTTQLPPAKSIIEIECQPDSMVYSWPASERHPMQWMPMLFGGVMILQALGIVGITVFDGSLQSQLWEMALAFLAFGGAGMFLFWSGYRKRGRETLQLGVDTLIYDNGPTILPRPLMWFVGFPFQLHPFFSNNYANPVPHFRRLQRTMLRGSIGPVVLERVGERQRLRLDHGRDRVEIGALLTEPEREWLAGVLLEWQSLSLPTSIDRSAPFQ